MKTSLLARALTSAFALFCANVLSAELVIFQDGTLNFGSLYRDSTTNASIAITSTQPLEGFDTIQFTPLNNSSFRSGGLSFFNTQAITVPAGDTVLRLSYRADTNQQISQFRVDTTAGNFIYNNSSSAHWTINGTTPGNTSLLLANTWYELSFSLAAINGFTPGTTQLNGQMSFTNRLSTGSVYIGDVRLTAIPEPSSAALLVGTVAGGLVLARRKRVR